MRKIPDFTSDTWQASRTDAQIGEVIRAGKGKSMPAMEGKVSREDRERLVALIRGFRGGKQSIAEDEEESEAGAAAVAVGAGGAEANPSLAPSSAPRLRTIVTYQKSCLVCHGPDGKGTPAAAGLHGLPDFRNKAWHAQRTPTQLAVSILEGKGKRMPAFRGKLTEPDARELALYVRTLGGASTASPNRTDPGEFEKQLDTLLREFDRLRRESRQLSQDSRRSMDAPTASNERE
jgi:mono/diheme cytochrome c family protein